MVARESGAGRRPAQLDLGAPTDSASADQACYGSVATAKSAGTPLIGLRTSVRAAHDGAARPLVASA
jgi:hypothetical protein